MSLAQRNPLLFLQVNPLSIELNGQPILSDLNWQLEAAQVWSVLGVSGRGKSTLLRLLAGLPVHKVFTLQGTVKWADQVLSRYSRLERAKMLSWVGQSDFQPFECTVAQRVLAGRYPHGTPMGWESQADYKMLSDALHAVGLANSEKRVFQSLSGGEQRRVSVAAALVQQAKVMLLDEPLSQLDWHHQTRVAGLFKPWAQQNQSAVVWITHDPNMALRYSTHCLALMPDGSAIQGPVADFYQADRLGRIYGCEVESALDTTCFFPCVL